MSWTDIFPVMTSEDYALYDRTASQDEKNEMEMHFRVLEVYQAQESKHIVSSSLFWRNARKEDDELPSPTRESMINARSLGLTGRYHPWEHYVQPLLVGAIKIKSERPDIVFRVYLAFDLKFLLTDLLAAGCEVHLMESSSVRHNPGAMWRFLALEEKGKWITVTDSDRAQEVIHDVQRTEHTMNANLGLWRVPYIFDSVKFDNDPGFYRPVIACQFGAKGGIPIKELMKAFVWLNENKLIQNCCLLGNNREGAVISGVDFPTYGFDEWCLLAVVYPRMAIEGVLTFLPWDTPVSNQWLALDIEYVTWANPKSELFFFGKSELAEKYASLRKRSVAQSAILENLLASAANRTLNTPPKDKDLLLKQQSVTVIVARYKENIRWLLSLKDDVEIILYNKGPQILDPEIIARVNQIIDLPNVGRESDTYLYHIGNHEVFHDEAWTIFLQGDPFPHSEQILNLIDRRAFWSDVQALTSGYLLSSNIPPFIHRQLDCNEWIEDIKIRTEPISLWSMDILKWQDWAGRKFIRDHINQYCIPEGWSLAGHFLEMCGLTDLAAKAWQASTGRMAYGAMFAVRNKILRNFPKESIPQMRKLAQEHYSNGYFFEKLWLHIMGRPFE
jgi:hypothetical protein